MRYEDANDSSSDYPSKSPILASGSSCSNTTSEDHKKLWNKNMTLYFINLVKEKDEQFQVCVKKQIWIKIASQVNEHYRTTLTWQQCETNWKGLTKIYREIIDHNKTSGKHRKNWDFLDAMHAVLFKKPEISPVATCSSSSGLQVNTETESSSQNSGENRDNILGSNFVRKRKSSTGANSIDRRHQEKMMRQDRFLNLFEQYIDILKNTQGSSSE